MQPLLKFSLERLPVGVGDELGGRERLPVRQHRDRGVLRAAGQLEIALQIRIECPRLDVERVAVVRRRRQRRLHRRTVAAPVRGEVVREIANRLDVVVGEHRVAGDGLRSHRAEIPRGGHRVPARGRGSGRDRVSRGWNRAAARESAAHPSAGAPGDDRAAAGRRREIPVAPIDAHVIAAAREHGLFRRADARDQEAGDARIVELHRLIGRVHRDFGAAVEVQLHLMRPAVHRRDIPCDVGNRSGQQIEIRRQRRRHERQGHLHARVREPVDRARRADGHRCLRKRGNIGRRRAHHARGVAVDSDQRRERMRAAGPVHRRGVGQPVGG